MILVDLNGLWDFTVDLDPKYHNSNSPVYARPGWDRGCWHKVPVPGVWIRGPVERIIARVYEMRDFLKLKI